MKILVFGKDGQLGKAFKAQFDQLIPTFENKPAIKYVGRHECDLSNADAISTLLNQIQPDLIVNASAYTAVDKAEIEVDLAYAINAMAPEIMAQYAVENNSTLLHYSTDYVFDGEKDGFYLEDDLRSPLGIYGKSKAAGEEAIVSLFSSGNTGRYAILRTSWVYGEGSNFIRTILRLAKEREELKIIADQYGVPTSANWLAIMSLSLALNQQGTLKTFPSGIYHAVPGGETTWHGLATLAAQSALEAGVILKVQPAAIQPIPALEYPLPAPRPMNSRMSTDKLQAILTQTKFPYWEGGVRDYVFRLSADGLI
jgi:dTDP-4-dehydrorhamnose reductase